MQYESNKVKKFLSIINPAIAAAIIPKITRSSVATKLWKAFFPISLKDLLANLQPTDAPNINKQ